MSSSDVPDAFISQIADRLHYHSVALLKVTVDARGSKRGHQIGSGTLISVNGISGILTAQHVAKQLDGHCWLGLTIGGEGQTHEFKIDKNHLQAVEIGTPETMDYGPDLAFINLAKWDVSTIKAYKSFHPLLADKDEMLSNPPSIDFGIWFMCGAPAERTSNVLSDGGFRESIIFQMDCGLCGVTHEYLRNDYDYLEASVEYTELTNPPSSLGGMSGGGLWQVLFAQLPDGTLVARRYLLAGVIFYQLALEQHKRLVRCHGRLSIYKHAIATIQAKCA